MQNEIFEKLDAWFAANGLLVEPVGKLFVGRKWSGEFNGRKVTAVCTIRTKTKYYGEDIRRREYDGHEFSVEMETPLQTRLTITPLTSITLGALERFLMKRVGLRQISIQDESTSHLRIWSHDDDWTLNFLANGGVQEQLIGNLLPRDAKSMTFSFQPKTVSFRMRRSLQGLTPDLIAEIISSISKLAEMAEALPAPVKIAKRTRFENSARENPVKFAVLLLLGLMVVFTIPAFLLFLVVVLGLEKFWIVGIIGIFFWWKVVKFRRKRRKAKRAAKAILEHR